MAELFAGEKLPKEEGKVSAAVFEDGIAVAANEVRQKKKRYRGLLMIMAALLVVVAGRGIGKSLKEKFAVYMVSMDATILEVHVDSYIGRKRFALCVLVAIWLVGCFVCST